MALKRSVAAAAALMLSGVGLHAAPVIESWNTTNVTTTITVPGEGAGVSVIYDRAAGAAGARSSGQIIFDGEEAVSPGLKVVNDAPAGDPPSNGDVSNCVMASSSTTCNGPQQSGKRLKFQRTGHESTDLVFNVNPNGTFTSTDNDGLYKFFMAFGNDTGGRLGSFSATLGTGLGAGFVASTDNDGLSFEQFADRPNGPNNSQFSALFSNGLFGPIDDIHPLLGYFSTERTGFNLSFDGEDRFASAGLFGDYAALFGQVLSYDELPLGYFFDDDGDAETDNVLIAHQLTDGTWVQNRELLGDGSVRTIASGNDGWAYDNLDDLLVALRAVGFATCDEVAAGVDCLAGTGAIDDLAKFNLTFFVDPTGFDGEQFTLRFDSTVPEPGSLALAALALVGAGAARRRRA